MSETPLYSKEDLERLTSSDKEAAARYEEYKSTDPFPDIVPALLNSADIFDYVVTTGMIHPFYPERLKSASYPVKLQGKCVYWREDGTKEVKIIEEGKDFVLEKNSIAFVTLEPRFRIADYIALRFNLKINHVYKGLLLGTGPLVDPGFNGKLSIPVHNLTTNFYTFRGGDELIWMEFTKLSPNERWAKQNYPIHSVQTRKGKYQPFPKDISKWDVEDYLRDAAPNLSIRSSIPDAVQDAREEARKAYQQAEIAAKDAEKAANEAKTAKNWGIAAAVAVIVGVAALTVSILGLVRDTKQDIDYVVNMQNELRTEVNRFPNQFKKLNEGLEELKKGTQMKQTQTVKSPEEEKKLNKKTPPQADKEINSQPQKAPEHTKNHKPTSLPQPE